MISFSIAMDPNNGIGLKGALPWHLKDELKLFKENTLHHFIIMGQTTFEGLPRKLVDRKVVVVSNIPEYMPSDPDAILERDLIGFLKAHQDDEEEYIVCGGASIYKQAYPYCKKAYISFVKNVYEVDASFTCFDMNDWNITKEVDYPDFIYRELIRKSF